MNTIGMRARARYPRTAVVLHWIVALSIVALLVTGWHMVGIPKSTLERAFFFNLHKSLGIVTAIFIVALIAWRIRHEPPPLLSAMPRWEKGAANLNHRLFYVCMVLMTLTGYLTSSFSKYGPKLFGISLPHWGWEDTSLRANFVAVHRATALIFAVLIAIHIAAALKHLLVDRDGVFQRMLLK
ncbi:cytochrome b [Burkholderia sp. SRS-46]|nr:cytochrome b [Burkholderia sp. SRS-46]